MQVGGHILLRQLINDVPARGDLSTDSTVAQIYRPIIRGYFGVAATYYLIMTLTHFWSLSGADLAVMATTSTIASVVILGAWHALRKPLTIGKLEALTSIVNLLVLSNVLVALHLEYAQAKLVYFMMMAMIFAFACVSMRQALISVAATLGGLFFMLIKQDPDQLSIYGFIAFAAALSAVAITFFLRRAIGLAVTARREAEVRLKETENLSDTMRQQSLTDSLTELPNRRAFFESFRTSKSNINGEIDMWLILLDLDGFKAVNDVYGHITSDELLKAVSNRMRDFCGTYAHVSRMGGDEFNIIFSSTEGEDEVEVWCKKLLEKIAEVYKIDDRLIQISCSIGCHRISAGESDTQLIRHADYALLHAKKHGKNRVVVFKEEHAKDAAERYKIEQALRVADFDSEIELLFQPQFDLGKDKIVGAEALARWNSPIVGQIGPDLFIKIAEESGLIASITLTVLEKAISALQGWENKIPLSINLSGHDLLSEQIIDKIIDQVELSGLAPTLIEFEVTETAMMVDTRKASANMLRLANLGHPLALDDFGTGYSNFNYLRTLPINKLKVDRSFMENLTDPMTEKMLHSLSGMARTLGVHCLLEGIENELELLMAKRVGAQSVQGYLFGMPMGALELLAHIDAYNDTQIRPEIRTANGE